MRLQMSMDWRFNMRTSSLTAVQGTVKKLKIVKQVRRQMT
jgi:hypothetical protein